MDAQTMVNVVVFALCAWLGMTLARRLPTPRNRWVKIAWLALLVISPAIGGGVRLVDIVFAVYLSPVLQGLVFGLIAGWWAKR
jgi:hypothetical protein